MAHLQRRWLGTRATTLSQWATARAALRHEAAQAHEEPKPQWQWRRQRRSAAGGRRCHGEADGLDRSPAQSCKPSAHTQPVLNSRRRAARARAARAAWGRLAASVHWRDHQALRASGRRRGPRSATTAPAAAAAARRVLLPPDCACTARHPAKRQRWSLSWASREVGLCAARCAMLRPPMLPGGPPPALRWVRPARANLPARLPAARRRCHGQVDSGAVAVRAGSACAGL